MKKWLKFFGLSFFSHSNAKSSTKRGYTNVFLGFVLAMVFLWAAYVGSNTLPFGVHYKRSPDFKATAYSVFINKDVEKRIEAEIEDGRLKAKLYGGKFADGVYVNTFDSESDKQNYSVNGYDIVVDTRAADTLAEVEAYCISNDGKGTVISYSDYLELSSVAKLNFDFKLRYTGNAFEPDSSSVMSYKAYLEGLSDEKRSEVLSLSQKLNEEVITVSEYNRAVYELYFTSYYPEITEYETTSRVPLLRNYYYHQYVSGGAGKYLFIFDDYMTGSFETKGGITVSVHGFYADLENGPIAPIGVSDSDASSSVDDFIKKSFKATGFLNSYAYALNIFSLVPFIALMLLVVTLLTYSISRLRAVESIRSFGAMFKIVGSFSWFSGVISAFATTVAAFFVKSNIISALPLVVFFVALAARSVIFAIEEERLYIKQSEKEHIQNRSPLSAVYRRDRCLHSNIR